MLFPQISFYSVLEEYADIKIDGHEFSREVHEMSCAGAEEALRIAKAFEINPWRMLDKREKNTLKKTIVGKIVLARFLFAERNFKESAGLFDEAIEVIGNARLIFENYVVSLSKLLIDKHDGSKSMRTLSRDHQRVKEWEKSLLASEELTPHLASHLLHKLILSTQNATAEPNKLTREKFFAALSASRFYNSDDLIRLRRCFTLADMESTVKKNLKDELLPHPDILPVPDKKSVGLLILDILDESFKGELALAEEDTKLLISIYGSLTDQHEATRDLIEKEIFIAGSADINRCRMVNIARQCFEQ